MVSYPAMKSVLETLNSKHIPVLPPGAPYLLKTLTDNSINFEELARVIERFPSIAARLISLANSAWSSPVNKITSIEMACSRLGFNVVRSLSIALAVASPFDVTRCPTFDGERYWCSALMVAEVAAMLAAKFDIEQEEDISTIRAAGLLHNLGMLLLVEQYPVEVNDALLYVNQEPSTSVQQALIQHLGCDDSDAGCLTTMIKIIRASITDWYPMWVVLPPWFRQIIMIKSLRLTIAGLKN